MKLRMGTRGSSLARAQSAWVAQRLAQHGFQVETQIIKTTGDLNRDAPLATLGGKGIFTREIEKALLDGEIDFAVHSLKDLPTELPPGLLLACTPEREDPRDALVARVPLEQLAPGAVVGTGSLRRQSQLRARRPDLELRDIRGNVPTRVQKWRSGEYAGGVVLAMAGVRRLGLEQAGLTEAELHPLQNCVPAPCQGILGLECRQSDEPTRQALARLDDRQAGLAALGERAFLRALGGGCNLPAGALVTLHGQQARLQAVLEQHHLQLEGPLEQVEELGRSAALELRGRCSP